MTPEEFKEIAENAISYLYDNDLLEDFLEDRGIELTQEKKKYFEIPDDSDDERYYHLSGDSWDV